MGFLQARAYPATNVAPYPLIKKMLLGPTSNFSALIQYIFLQARAYPATDVAPYPQMPAKLKIVRVLKPWRCAQPTRHVSSSKDCTKKDQVSSSQLGNEVFYKMSNFSYGPDTYPVVSQ